VFPIGFFLFVVSIVVCSELLCFAWILAVLMGYIVARRGSGVFFFAGINVGLLGSLVFFSRNYCFCSSEFLLVFVAWIQGFFEPGYILV